MVYKRCHERDECAEGVKFHAGRSATPRCDHPWHIKITYAGRTVRGPVDKFRFLLAPGEPVPTDKTGARELERLVHQWLRNGCPPPAAPAPGRELEARAAQVPALVGDGLEAPAAGRVVSIQAAVARYQIKHIARLADNSASWVTARIGADVGTRPITDLLEPALIAGWLDDLIEESDAGLDGARTNNTINKYRARWSHLITFCRLEYGLTGNTPFYHPILNPSSDLRRLKGGRRKRRLIRGEEPRLIRACESFDDGGQMLGRVYCALDAGLRRREMLLVDVDHIRRGPHGIGIYIPAAHAKSGNDRTVPVTSRRLLAFLKARQKALARTFGGERGPRFVFGQIDGARLDGFTLDWEKVQRAGGFRAGEYRGVDGDRRPDGRARRLWTWTVDENLHWHDLRHECGSRLAQGTRTTPAVPLRDIQEMLGHAKLSTTEIYLQTSHESVARNMRRVHRSMGI